VAELDFGVGSILTKNLDSSPLIVRAAIVVLLLLLQWVGLTLVMVARMMAASRAAPATTPASMARWTCTSTCHR
jgi:hypothetical protein